VAEVTPGTIDRDETSPRVTFREVRIGQAWNVRGDARNASFIAQAGRLFGALPAAPLTSARFDDHVSLWLGPRSWLVVTAPSAHQHDYEPTRVAINAAGGALFDVSASYVGWSIAGARAARVLNRECPLDLSPRAFPAGHCAQSVLGHVNALFYRPRDLPSFVVVAARSFAADAWRALTTAASAEGYDEVEAVEFSSA
jgi:sarcosine oxidase subunit gamma